MKAVTYQWLKNVKVKEVPDETIQKSDDFLVRITTTTTICGSDLHLYNIIGHQVTLL
jgi:S-(hydroxymethyl)glutathione dehydrogenase/alcohol dehydrogenase